MQILYNWSNSVYYTHHLVKASGERLAWRNNALLTGVNTVDVVSDGCADAEVD